MIVVVTGGRLFTNATLLFSALDAIEPRPTLIVEGGQRSRDKKGKIIGGADYWAMKWAELRKVPCKTVRASWSDLVTEPVRIKQREDGSSYNAMAGLARNHG